VHVVVASLAKGLRTKLALNADHVHGLVVSGRLTALAVDDIPALGGDVHLAVVTGDPAGSLHLGSMGAVGMLVVHFRTLERVLTKGTLCKYVFGGYLLRMSRFEVIS
jgi:hypothetical protein